MTPEVHSHSGPAGLPSTSPGAGIQDPQTSSDSPALDSSAPIISKMDTPRQAACPGHAQRRDDTDYDHVLAHEDSPPRRKVSPPADERLDGN